MRDRISIKAERKAHIYHASVLVIRQWVGYSTNVRVWEILPLLYAVALRRSQKREKQGGKQKVESFHFRVFDVKGKSLR